MERILSKAMAAGLVAVGLANASMAQTSTGFCGTPTPTNAQVQSLKWVMAERSVEEAEAGEVQIPIAFHNVFSGRQGKVTDGQIRALVNNLNVGFEGTPFSFYLYRVDRTNNKAWYSNCGLGTGNETKMKKRLAKDPRYVLNIYTCIPSSAGLPPGQVLLGFAYLPFMAPEASFMHGVILHPSALPGGTNPDYGTYGLVAIHEVGHYLGLLHTFQGGCEGDGDFVADTPAQSVAHFSCPIGVDTCLDAEGPDDTTNFMNYSNDRCMDHFTPGQIELMTLATQYYKPSLWQ